MSVACPRAIGPLKSQWGVQELNLAGASTPVLRTGSPALTSYRPGVWMVSSGPKRRRATWGSPGWPLLRSSRDELQKGSGRPIVATDGERRLDERHATKARATQSRFAGQTNGPDGRNRGWQRIHAPRLGLEGFAGGGMCELGKHGVLALVLCLSRGLWRCDVRRRRSFQFSASPSPSAVASRAGRVHPKARATNNQSLNVRTKNVKHLF